jgi:6-pyruvoyltetrahydropterin/6-carboxytetrahydropterin synthase
MRYTFRMTNFKVHVSKDYLVFCAAHFVTYDGVCEPLHGHNYRASVTVEGALQEDQFVFNFVTLKRIMRGLVDQLDHLTLLPEFNPRFHLTRANGEVIVEAPQRRYVLPESDVKVLPIANTTAEKLAEYLAGQLREQIGHLLNLTACEMEVSEVEGQSAIYREEWR